MNRRQFVSTSVKTTIMVGLLESSISPITLHQSGEVLNTNLKDGLIEYKGRNLMWTGWKSTFDGTKLFGQWVTWDEKKPMLYAAIPGREGEWKRGDKFDVGQTHSQPFVNYELLANSLGLGDKLKDEALGRIKRLIDNCT